MFIVLFRSQGARFLLETVVIMTVGHHGAGKMWFKKDPSFEYLPFEIGKFHNFRASTSAARALAFFRKYFEWVDSQLSSGHNVLVHCLAGAHRAGTAGIAYLMHACKLDRIKATAMAKAARPVINPIYRFRDLLKVLELGLDPK